jgi:hypothetical protein
MSTKRAFCGAAPMAGFGGYPHILGSSQKAGLEPEPTFIRAAILSARRVVGVVSLRAPPRILYAVTLLVYR